MFETNSISLKAIVYIFIDLKRERGDPFVKEAFLVFQGLLSTNIGLFLTKILPLHWILQLFLTKKLLFHYKYLHSLKKISLFH